MVNYNILKTEMRKHLGDIVDLLNYLFVDDHDAEYRCDYISVSKDFKHLHKCVLLSHKLPAMDDYLEEYLKICNNINETNEKGMTALHLAASNSEIRSTDRTVQILIDAGIDVNLQNIQGETALHLFLFNNLSNDWYKPERITEKRTLYVLLNGGADIFNIKDSYGKTVCDYLTEEQKKVLQIDKTTKTIGYFNGMSTKGAITKKMF